MIAQMPAALLLALIFSIAPAAVFAFSVFAHIRRGQRRSKEVAYQDPPTLDRSR